ncbi:MAG TPA: winged helix-turn-helix domain-containing protein [Trebonia sp.]|nr:winged helix-turn-helix domain-containing protein [Trebonia sp.]
MAVDHDSGDYVYEQVAAILRERIANGTYRAGRVMPSARTLSQELGVSIGSVKHAIELLRAEDLVETRIGRGIVVRSNVLPR